MKLNRRDFLKSMSAAACALLFPKVASAQGNDTPKVDGKDALVSSKVASDIHIARPLIKAKTRSFLPSDLDRTILPPGRVDGIRSIIPYIPALDTDPRVPSITGFISAEPSSPDDDAPAGYMKGCAILLPFGTMRYDSNSIELDRAYARINRGDYTDIKLFSSVLGLDIPDIELASLTEGNAMSLITLAEMTTVEVLMNRALAQQVWNGNPKLNQFAGLDEQISVGLKEGETGLPIPSLDSDVKDFGFEDIAISEKSIVEYLSMMSFYTQLQARRYSLEPCEWVIAMRPELWYELTSLWPSLYFGNIPSSGNDWVCKYCGSMKTVPLTKCWDGSSGCGGSKPPISGYACTYCGRVYSKYRDVCWDGVDGCGAIESLEKVTKEFESYFSALSSGNEIALRDWMRNELKIPINGYLYKVVLDDGIEERNATNAGGRLIPGDFASTLYFVPVTILGGRPVTYMEYFKCNDPFAEPTLNDEEFWTDGGVVAWKIDQCKWDYTLQARTQQRIVLRTPHLAAKLKNVGYSPGRRLRY